MSRTEIHAPDGDLSQSLSDAWRLIADKALRGADYDQTLVRVTADGIQRGPVFFSAPDVPAISRGDHPDFLPWDIRQSFSEASLAAGNAAILSDLSGGVSQIGLHIDPEGRHGLPVNTGDDLKALLAGADITIAPVHIEPGSVLDAQAIGDALANLGAVNGGFGLRPDASGIADLAKTFTGFSIVSVDARSVHEAGGSEAQEIAYAAAGFNEALGRLLDGGIELTQAVLQIETVMAADADIHLTIAKMRAVRLVLANIMDAYGSNTPASVRAVTSGRMMTRRDPWTNIIRMSAAAFAGAVGGADTLSILPATHALGRPDSLARRTARNLHILLQEESHAGQVSDPASGSYWHDTMTETLARRAWDIFKSTERGGGFASLGSASGFAGDVLTARNKLGDLYSEQKSIQIGVNRHAAPDLREMNFLEGEMPPFGDNRFEPVRLESLCAAGDE